MICALEILCYPEVNYVGSEYILESIDGTANKS